LKENIFDFEQLILQPPALPINIYESLFISVVQACELLALNPPSIRCIEPVINEKNKPRKVLTSPDCLVINLNTQKYFFVEVTGGEGKGRHKKAQQRVVEQAEKELGKKLWSYQIATPCR
jgi:hypothetical protein